MKPTEFVRCYITDPESSARKRTSYLMNRKTALERFPGAEPDPLARELRNLAESRDEWHVARRS